MYDPCLRLLPKCQGQPVRGFGVFYKHQALQRAKDAGKRILLLFIFWTFFDPEISNKSNRPNRPAFTGRITIISPQKFKPMTKILAQPWDYRLTHRYTNNYLMLTRISTSRISRSVTMKQDQNPILR